MVPFLKIGKSEKGHVWGGGGGNGEKSNNIILFGHITFDMLTWQPSGDVKKASKHMNPEHKQNLRLELKTRVPSLRHVI